MGADAAMGARLLLAARLRSLRDATRLPAKRAAEALGSSLTKVSRIESGRAPAQPGDVEALLDLYGVSDPAEHMALRDLARQAGQPGWWDRFSEPLPSGLRHDLSLEAAADVIMIYDSQAIPALLQTPDYARALAVTGPRATWRAGMNPWILGRRRQLLQSPTSPQLWAVISSAVLSRPPAGDTGVLRRQIQHLMAIVGSRNLTIQVISPTAPIELAAPGPFTLLRFAQPELPDLVLFEQLTATATLDRPSEVEHYRELFDTMIAADAYTTDESRQALAEVLLSLELAGHCGFPPGRAVTLLTAAAVLAAREERYRRDRGCWVS